MDMAMSEIEKGRIQRDARRTVAGRRSTSSSDPSEAIIRHLGVELYKERHRTEHTPDAHEIPEPDETTDDSPDR
jgi:hypothetical protein